MEEAAAESPQPASHSGAYPAANELERRAAVVERLREADRQLARDAAVRLECVDALRREAEVANANLAEDDAANTTDEDAGSDAASAARARVRFSTSPDIQRRSVRAELAAASRISERAAETQLAMAEALMTEQTATMDALRAGDIGERHARLVWEHTIQVPAEHRAEFERQALDAARRLSPARLVGKLRDLQERLEPEAATERHRTALEQRDVWVDSLADGMAILSARITAVNAIAAANRIEEYARGITAGPDERRTLAQVRADIATEFLLNGEVGDRTIVPTVHVVVPALSLAGVSEELAILEGYGPMDLASARKLLAGADEFIRVVTHPVTGTVLAVDSYKPTKALRRWLEIRDEICRAPGCGRRAVYAELDHSVERASDHGPTAIGNLAHLCINHHKLKTLTGWNYEHLDRFGTLEWTTPLGEAYITEPAVRMRGAPHLADAVREATFDTDDPPFPDPLDEPVDLSDCLRAEIEALLDADLEAAARRR